MANDKNGIRYSVENNNNDDMMCFGEDSYILVTGYLARRPNDTGDISLSPIKIPFTDKEAAKAYEFDNFDDHMIAKGIAEWKNTYPQSIFSEYTDASISVVVEIFNCHDGWDAEIFEGNPYKEDQ